MILLSPNSLTSVHHVLYLRRAPISTLVSFFLFIITPLSFIFPVGVGTPMYMSPEILAKKPYDTKSDVFSYGVMLWILYCQKEPYKHIEHSWEIARFVMEGNREKIPKDCPSDFKELIEQCWSQEPNQRPEFQEIATRLEQMVESCNEVQPSPRSPRSKKSLK
jgi:serine/threonine protein kinase